MVNKSEIREHAQVIASCGTHVGTIDHLEGEDKIKLAKSDSASGGVHHYIPLSWVEKVDGNNVVLNKNSEEVKSSWQTA
ncbi:DUF2171 domain-containing protein [Pseudescherichia vulneris]|uniref:DUF2171 domain-containing protein n=1 Tax=Pseudescherichia vulneris TaxID=566 RepID=UPI0028D2D970|nr:DUF2171 domain-containing protein [Pseudescherichia vulneris]